MIEPYYSDESITIYHGDCRAVLGQISGKLRCEVNVVVTDPPYGATKLPWDCWPYGWPSAVDEFLPTNVPLWCFGSMRMFFDHLREFEGWRFAQDIVWEKQNGSNFVADRFRRVHELVTQWYRGAWSDVYRSAVFTDDAVARRVRRRVRPEHMGNVGDSRYVSVDGGQRLQRSVIQVRSSHHAVTSNPTQKPTGIIEPLLAYNCPPGGLVLDPMMGSGSTLRAARDRGCRAIGIELRESECAAAVKRLDQRSVFEEN